QGQDYPGGDTQVGPLGIMLNNGDGTFQAPRIFSGGSDSSGFDNVRPAFAGGDLNGDGVPDIVITNLDLQSDKTTINVANGLGDGTFASPVSYPESITYPT